MLELSIHAGIPGNKIQAHSASNGTTWITGSDEHGNCATIYIEEEESNAIMEVLSKAFTRRAAEIELLNRLMAEPIPTSTVTENQHL